MARISEVITTSAFMLPLRLHKNLEFFLFYASLKPDTIVLIAIGNQQSVAIFIDTWRNFSYFKQAYKRKKC